jgi:phosphoglycolate phosphatase-like HAD superfamily hydrolase
MKWPYFGLIETTARDSGAGAYSKLIVFSTNPSSHTEGLSNNLHLTSCVASIDH